MNIETCMRRSAKYSSASTSSIATTLPSAGATIALSCTVNFLLGIRKKEIRKINKPKVPIKMIQLNAGEE
jgi:hypothetical protein